MLLLPGQVGNIYSTIDISNVLSITADVNSNGDISIEVSSV
jgi:hypothetical protein